MRKVLVIALAAYLGVLGFFGYARLWERSQPIQEFRNARVSRVEYYSGRNDLGFSSGFYKIFINEETRPIYLDRDFKMKIERGDLVNLKTRRGFPIFEDHFDGTLD